MPGGNIFSTPQHPISNFTRDANAPSVTSIDSSFGSPRRHSYLSFGKPLPLLYSPQLSTFPEYASMILSSTKEGRLLRNGNGSSSNLDHPNVKRARI
ncbi:hypothetical protein MRB53_028723 [Persea americana]|uniref:Uncharacterized protein n=1 Tax=Persea americana TaxID=3435 RepID=A0ACC2KGB7_PERAE|nr:hypothetical protein MRB53_028723 [Persea americana]